EVDEKKRKEEEQKRKEEEEEEKKKEEEEKKKEEDQKRKEAEEAKEKKKRKEEEKKKSKEAEEAEKTEEEEKKRKEEEEAERRGRRRRKRRRGRCVMFPILHIQTSFSWDEKKTATRDIYGRSEDYRYYKALKVNVSTSEPIFVGSQESTDTLPTSKKQGRRDYVAQEVLRVDEKSRIE
ncbi:hypothetical protein Taro_012076, partial [Colocasia esculenta]|nr:hypothetical protein [Colocasia esculenta]